MSLLGNYSKFSLRSLRIDNWDNHKKIMIKRNYSTYTKSKFISLFNIGWRVAYLKNKN